MNVDGSLVKEVGADPVYVIVGGARLHVPSPQEFEACGYRWADVNTVPDGTLAVVPTMPRVGTLVRERGRDEIWVACDGRRVWMPTTDAIAAMGLSADAVRIVPQGSIEHIPRVRLASRSTTPSSMVFPPTIADGWAPPRAKWWPRGDVPGITLPNGARVVEIHGWVVGVEEAPNDVDPDWHLDIEPDPAWLDAIGVDWPTIFRLGDILAMGINPQTNDRFSWVTTPVFHVELNGWPENPSAHPGDHWTKGAHRPADWTAVARDANGDPIEPGVVWPFVPTVDSGGRRLAAGDYVRVSGSLVTDVPHQAGGDFWTALDQLTGIRIWNDDYLFAANDWDAGHGEDDESCPARWTEFHPPDLVELVDPTEPTSADLDHPSHPRAERIYGVAVIARAAPLNLSGADKSLTVDLAPPGPRPGPHSRLFVREFVGPETNFRSIVEGNHGLDGAQMTLAGDHVRLHVAVHGEPFAGPPGKFKAVYRVGWENDPASYLLAVLVSPESETIPYDVPVTVTVTAIDPYTGVTVPGSVALGGTVVGSTGAPFVATFHAGSRRVFVPGDPDAADPADRKAHWVTQIDPPLLTVHPPAPYDDTSVAIGKY
jgi:hypothetical protein